MIAVRAITSFCTYVGADCVSAAEGSTIYVPKDKASTLVDAGLVVLIENAPPVPPQTKVSPYVPPETDPTKTHPAQIDPAQTDPVPSPSDEPTAERLQNNEHGDDSQPGERVTQPVPRKPSKRTAARRRTRPN